MGETRSHAAFANLHLLPDLACDVRLVIQILVELLFRVELADDGRADHTLAVVENGSAIEHFALVAQEIAQLDMGLPGSQPSVECLFIRAVVAENQILHAAFLTLQAFLLFRLSAVPALTAFYGLAGGPDRQSSNR